MNKGSTVTLKNILVALAATLALAACNSSKSPTDANFAQAIDNHFAAHCLPLDAGNVFGPSSFPVAVKLAVEDDSTSAETAAARNAENTARFDALVKAGLLSVADGQTDEFNIYLAKKRLVPTKVYSLTPAGKAALVRKDGKGTAFCAATYKVERVVRSAKSGDGSMSVAYTFGPGKVAGWLKLPEVQKAFPNLDRYLTSGQKGTKELVLANDGWIVADDFNE